MMKLQWTDRSKRSYAESNETNRSYEATIQRSGGFEVTRHWPGGRWESLGVFPTLDAAKEAAQERENRDANFPKSAPIEF